MSRNAVLTSGFAIKKKNTISKIVRVKHINKIDNIPDAKYDFLI
jgi:hypothetical protein